MPPSAKPPSNGELVAIWFAISLIFALLVGSGAGLLDWRGGHSPTTALLAAGAAFGGALTLMILVINLLRR